MNAEDLGALKAIADWETEGHHRPQAIFIQQLAERLGALRGEIVSNTEILSLARSVRRLVDGGMVKAEAVRSQDEAYREYLLFSVTGPGMDAIDSSPTVAQSPVSIHIEGSNIGLVNAGSLVGDIQAHVSAVVGPSAGELRELVQRLLEAVEADSTVAPATKAEILESLDYLVEAAGMDQDRRRVSVLKTTIEHLTAVVAGSLAADAWNALHPALQKALFG